MNKSKQTETKDTVYQAISKVQAEISKEGISKDRKNTTQGYQFRGIDDIYNALSPILSKHGVCIMPKCLSRECIERPSKQGGVLFNVVVDVEYTFVGPDGSSHVVRMPGEAMDSGDKATNKALSAAYKYACMQVFSIPTEGENDADQVSHEVAATNQPRNQAPKPPAKPTPAATALKAESTTEDANSVRAQIERDHGVTAEMIRANFLLAAFKKPYPTDPSAYLEPMRFLRTKLTGLTGVTAETLSELGKQWKTENTPAATTA